jgi:hypothetical protein
MGRRGRGGRGDTGPLHLGESRRYSELLCISGASVINLLQKNCAKILSVALYQFSQIRMAEIERISSEGGTVVVQTLTAQ